MYLSIKIMTTGDKQKIISVLKVLIVHQFILFLVIKQYDTHVNVNLPIWLIKDCYLDQHLCLDYVGSYWLSMDKSIIGCRSSRTVELELELEETIVYSVSALIFVIFS